MPQVHRSPRSRKRADATRQEIIRIIDALLSSMRSLRGEDAIIFLTTSASSKEFGFSSFEFDLAKLYAFCRLSRFIKFESKVVYDEF